MFLLAHTFAEHASKDIPLAVSIRFHFLSPCGEAHACQNLACVRALFLRLGSHRKRRALRPCTRRAVLAGSDQAGSANMKRRHICVDIDVQSHPAGHTTDKNSIKNEKENTIFFQRLKNICLFIDIEDEGSFVDFFEVQKTKNFTLTLWSICPCRVKCYAYVHAYVYVLCLPNLPIGCVRCSVCPSPFASHHWKQQHLLTGTWTQRVTHLV